MKPAAFTYHAPESLDEALALLAALEDAKPLAGGQSLVPLLHLRLAAFAHLVDLGRIGSLRGVEHRNGDVWVGALTTQATLERDPIIARAVPLVARAVPWIGHPAIRTRGTLGGSLAHADPAAELPAVAVALDATVEIAGPHGPRAVPAREAFIGLWSTTLADDEVLTGVRFPVWPGRCGFAVHEVARRHGDFALAGACVAVALDAEGTIERCAIALMGMGATPRRAIEAEAQLVGMAAGSVGPRHIGEIAIHELDDVPSDSHLSAGHRRQLAAVSVARAVHAALGEATATEVADG